MTPSLLFYCQHSLGMGHLVRSFAVAAGLSEHFRVVFLSGGPLPDGALPPDGVEVVALPPLGLAPGARGLVSRDAGLGVEEARALRRRAIHETFEAVRPRVILIELFPFGRKKFAAELIPLLETATALTPRPLILCSLRDILVSRGADQARYDDRAASLAHRYFDAVLVHADPTFARLEESFRPSSPLRIPIHYTGFVTAHTNGGRDQTGVPQASRPIVVSAGGGIVGEPLLRTALEAHALLWPSERVPMKIIAGPFLPDEAWRSLSAAAHVRPGLELRRQVPDLVAELETAAASISQCGYNTALEILQSGVPAVVVPFADGAEDEQMTRARRLERLGALRVLEPGRLDPPTLATEIHTLLRFRPRRPNLDLQGASATADFVARLSGLLPSSARCATEEMPR